MSEADLLERIKHLEDEIKNIKRDGAGLRVLPGANILGQTTQVNGLLRLLEQPASPAASSGFGQLYPKAADGHLYYTGDDGIEKDISSPTGAVAHASTHQNGGGDELNVAGLNGVLADAQTPKAHTHDIYYGFVTKQSATTIPNNTMTILNFDTLYQSSVPSGVSPMWSASDPTKMYIRKTGIYFISAQATFQANGTNGDRLLAVIRNGNGLDLPASSRSYVPSGYASMTCAAIYALNAGDYLQSEVLQTCGGNLVLGFYKWQSPTLAAYLLDAT